MFQGKAAVAIAQSIALFFACIILLLIGLAVLQPINASDPEFRSSAAYSLPTIIFVLSGLCLLAGAARFYMYWREEKLIREEEYAEMESFSDEDIAEQERLTEENENLDKPYNPEY